VWALQSNSELQRRDIRQLLVGSIDRGYIRQWAQQLAVTTLLEDAEMNDTSDAISKIVFERYRSMTPAERWLGASSPFATARAIIQSSLPSALTAEQLRLAIVQRLYKGELPEGALVAHANSITAKGTLRIPPEQS
jgi:hypothetical protein